MKKLILFFSFFWSIVINAQNFKVDFDYARFLYSDSSDFVEIYYSFYQPHLTQVHTNNQIAVTGILNVKISDKNNANVLVNKSYKFNDVIDDSLIGKHQKSFTGNLGFIVPFGEYNCILTGIDGNDLTKKDSMEFPITLTKLPSDRFYISDLEIASTLKKSEQTNSMFYKNTYEVVPNPSGIFGQEVPVLYFYSEVYNLDKDINSQYLKMDHLLLNTENKTVYKKTKLFPRTTNSAVDVEALNISKLPSGTYTLVDAATDSAKNLTVYSSKKVFIYNPSVADTTPMVSTDNSVLTSEFASMSDDELSEVYNESKYLATGQEKEQWKTLTTEQAKQNFLFKFWKARDLTPETPSNEFKRDYLEKVKKANQLYSNIQKKGWQTDRGRVLLLYGDPSEVERFPNEISTKPYEIWHYNDLEGGVIFVFADLTGFSDYTLIHSTKRGEISDPDWDRKIYGAQ
jgi:GWxTD domain-containing protein